MRDTLHTGSSVAVVSSNRTLPFRVFAALLAGAGLDSYSGTNDLQDGLEINRRAREV
jgi:hypothetical protein